MNISFHIYTALKPFVLLAIFFPLVMCSTACSLLCLQREGAWLDLGCAPTLCHSPFQQLWDHRQVRRENWSVNCCCFSRNVSLGILAPVLWMPRALRTTGSSHLISNRVLNPAAAPRTSGYFRNPKAQLNIFKKAQKGSGVQWHWREKPALFYSNFIYVI